MTIVKICGITNIIDANMAVDNGADMIGFIMARMSKRFISPEEAREMVITIKNAYGVDAPVCVGVFVTKNMTIDFLNAEIKVSGVDVAQLTGLESPEWLSHLSVPAYAAIRPEKPDQAVEDARKFDNKSLADHLPTILVDAFHPTMYGGTGETTSTEVANTVKNNTNRLMLAGGLTPENVGDYVQEIKPWAVDVASGTEASPGHKDPQKLRRFIVAAKQGAKF